MKYLALLFASVLACAGQLTLENAHYPTIFRGGGGITQPPVSGFQLWIAPESTAWSDFNGTTVATQNQNVVKLEDLSGQGNHLYWPSNFNGPSSEGCHFDTAYTLNSKRILQFGRNCLAGVVANKTGLITSNNVTLIGGVTVFTVGSFIAPCSSSEAGGVWFGYNGLGFLMWRNNLVDQMATFHSSSSLVLADSVTTGLSNYNAWAFVFDDAANSSSLYRSNSVVATATDNGAMPATGKVTIGYADDGSGVNFHLNGGLLEMIVYTNALSAIQISNVNVYLKNKYFP